MRNLYDESTEQQARKGERNVSVRGRKVRSQTEGRSRKLQVNIKMMNFNKKSRRRERDLNLSRGACNSSALSGNCAEGNAARENRPQSSAVRDILLL